MGFEKKTWVNRSTEFPTRRVLTPVSGEANTYDVSRSEGTITEAGDAFDATNMNDLEGRIEAGFNGLYQVSITLPASWTNDSANGFYYQTLTYDANIHGDHTAVKLEPPAFESASDRDLYQGYELDIASVTANVDPTKTDIVIRAYGGAPASAITVNLVVFGG